MSSCMHEPLSFQTNVSDAPITTSHQFFVGHPTLPLEELITFPAVVISNAMVIPCSSGGVCEHETEGIS